MKKNDIELIIDTLKDVKRISDRLDYNSSRDINTRLMTVMPILQGELENMEGRKIEITTVPKIMLICGNETLDDKSRIVDCVNKKLEELVVAGNKIIDFGVSETSQNSFYAYIKYMVG